MRTEQRRQQRIGYANGGMVDPYATLLQSAAVDSRKKANEPLVDVEDRVVRATRPVPSPRVPKFRTGYQEGGEVEDDDDDLLPEEIEPDEPDDDADAAGLSPDDDEELPPEEPDELAPEEAEPQAPLPPPGEEEEPPPPAAAEAAAPDEAAPDEAAPDEAEAAPPATGYAPQAAIRPPAQQPTGFQAPAVQASLSKPEQALRDVVSFAHDNILTGAQGEDTLSEQPDSPQAAMRRGADPQLMQEYVSGTGRFAGFPPDRMDEILNKVSMTNPDLTDPGAAIQKGFQNFVDAGDNKGALDFIQPLKMSFNNTKGIAMAAMASGDVNTALQLMERMHDLVPDGQKVNFIPNPQTNTITAVVRSADGAPTTYNMTADQVGRYLANQTLDFDHVAMQGPNANLAMVTGGASSDGSLPRRGAWPIGASYPIWNRKGCGREPGTRN